MTSPTWFRGGFEILPGLILRPTPLPERLLAIHGLLDDLMSLHQPSIVAVERLMNAMLFNAGGVDLLVYLVVVPAMVLVTMLAAYVPARKASRIAPTIALRYE